MVIIHFDLSPYVFVLYAVFILTGRDVFLLKLSCDFAQQQNRRKKYHFRFKGIKTLELPEITMVTSSEVMAVAHITIETRLKKWKLPIIYLCCLQ